MKTSFYFLVSLLLLLSIEACTYCNEPQEECPDNIACTEVFVSVVIPFDLIGIDITDVDFSKTYLESTNENIYEHKYNPPFDIGPYHAVIVTDGQLQKIMKEGSKLRFELYNTSGNKIYEATFIIGHDCCHVLKISGPDKITL